MLGSGYNFFICEIFRVENLGGSSTAFWRLNPIVNGNKLGEMEYGSLVEM